MATNASGPDPSEGGKARAKALTPKRRGEIARRAADARWNTPEATHEGVVYLADQELTCAVLSDGRRVLDQQSFRQAIGKKGKQRTAAFSDKDAGSYSLQSFLDAANLKPYIDNILQAPTEPIVFRTASGQRAHGFEARLLPLVCDVYLQARKDKALTVQQLHIADACEMLVRALAQVGIVALVDEATGYQEVRDRRALQAILDQYLRQEFAVWAKRFPDEFYKQMFRLRGWTWRGMKVNRPQCVAAYTKDLIYQRLAAGIVEELEQRNPVQDNGRRKAAHHQWLTDEVGHPALANHLSAVLALMRASPERGWNQFMEMMNRALPRRGHSIQLTFDDLDVDEPI